LPLITHYKDKIENELKGICNDVLLLLDAQNGVDAIKQAFITQMGLTYKDAGITTSILIF
jgi:hypothetical protein